MVGELLCALWLVFRPASISLAPVAWAGLALVVAIWLSTAVIQIPCHHRLAQGFDDRVHRRLVRTNWIRTVAWTARGVLVLEALRQFHGG